MDNKEAGFLILRYLLLLPLGIITILIEMGRLIDPIFTPLTVQPVYFFLHRLYDAVLLEGNVLFFKGYYAEIITACVGIAAYYFLLILNLTTPMHPIKRVKSLAFILLTFLILNIIRIVVFGTLMFRGYQYFDITHQLTWYFGSTILVILIWFANVLIFKVSAIPIYTDVKNLSRDIFRKKNN